MSAEAKKTELAVGKKAGASPTEDRFYVVVFFDIADAKKYRLLVKTLKSYGSRIQKSVFEAQLSRRQIRDLLAKVEQLMSSETYYNPSDNVRVYKIAGNCEITIFGANESSFLEENIFI